MRVILVGLRSYGRQTKIELADLSLTGFGGFILKIEKTLKVKHVPCFIELLLLLLIEFKGNTATPLFNI